MHWKTSLCPALCLSHRLPSLRPRLSVADVPFPMWSVRPRVSVESELVLFISPRVACFIPLAVYHLRDHVTMTHASVHVSALRERCSVALGGPVCTVSLPSLFLTHLWLDFRLAIMSNTSINTLIVHLCLFIHMQPCL